LADDLLDIKYSITTKNKLLCHIKYKQ